VWISCNIERATPAMAGTWKVLTLAAATVLEFLCQLRTLSERAEEKIVTDSGHKSLTGGGSSVGRARALP
jgi:hypothetical protein